jgi:hypothetical protein
VRIEWGRDHPHGVDFHILSVHFDSGTTSRDYTHRRQATQRIGAIAMRDTPILQSDRDVVVLGDYHTMGKEEAPPVSAQEEIAVFDGELAPGFRRLPMAPTCTEYHQGQGGRLDHVVVSTGIQEVAATARVTGYCAVAECAAITGTMPAASERLSDHCPSWSRSTIETWIEGTAVSPPPDQTSELSSQRVRMDARLDTMTRTKVDDLAKRFHKPRAAVVCYIMQWGLSRGPTEKFDGGASEGPVRHLSLYVDTELHEHIERAATAVSMYIAPWLRAMVRQITLTDFPASWQEATPSERSHDSLIYTKRVMLRLDEPSQATLQQLMKQFGVSKVEIIRQLIAQSNAEDFPPRWQLRAAERQAKQARQNASGKPGNSSPLCVSSGSSYGSHEPSCSVLLGIHEELGA